MKTFKLCTIDGDFRINLYDVKIINGLKNHKVKLYINNRYIFSTTYGIEHFIYLFNNLIELYFKYFLTQQKEIKNWIEESLNYSQIIRKHKIEKLLKNIKTK